MQSVTSKTRLLALICAVNIIGHVLPSLVYFLLLSTITCKFGSGRINIRLHVVIHQAYFKSV